MLIQAGVNLPPSYVCLEGPLGGERPRAQGDEMLMQRLLPAVREALDEAAVKPEEIDLIVGLALSPDHLIENRDIMAPKIGHPLQKILGANRAHVFDLTDSSWLAPSTWSIPRQRPGLSQRPGRARRIQPGIGSGQRVWLRPCRRRPGAALPADRQGRVPSRCAGR